MLNSSEILIHWHPVIHSLLTQRPLMVVRTRKTVKVPGGFNEGVHRVCFPSGWPTALRTLSLYKFLHPDKRRLSHSSDFHIEGKNYREIFFRNRQSSTPIAIDDGNRCSPITLSGDTPIS